MTDLRSASSRAKRGFTLTEMAIVLGIVSLVLAAIWAGANVARKNANVRSAADETMIILNNMRALYSSQASGKATIQTMADLCNAGIFPAGSATCGVNPVVRNPWNGETKILAGNTDDAAGTHEKSFFRITMDNIPPGDCIKLVTWLLNANGLQKILSEDGATWVAANASVADATGLNEIAINQFACPDANDTKRRMEVEFSLWDAPM